MSELLPRFEKKIGWRWEPFDQYKREERIHLLALMLALYPFTSNAKLSEEFMIPASRVKQIALEYGVRKTQEFRKQICRKNGRVQFLHNIWAERKLKTK